MSELAPSLRGHVVIAGGGVAAVEALIALRELAPGRVRVTLVAPRRRGAPSSLRVAVQSRLHT